MEKDCVVIRWKLISGDSKNVYATLFGAFASLVMVILFLWTVWSGFGVAEEPSMKKEFYKFYNYGWAVYGGVLTIVLGFLFLLVGFPILADLFSKLFEQFRKPDDENGTHQGEKMKTICIISRIIVSVAAMVMLAWAIYTGFKLATGSYYHLSSPVDVVSVVFGVMLFIIRIGVVAELAVELTKRLQRNVNNEIVVHQVCNIDIKCIA